MTLLEQLRDPASPSAREYKSLGDLCREAADEIERLRSEITRLEDEIKATAEARALASINQ